jgi:hypothetical protein
MDAATLPQSGKLFACITKIRRRRRPAVIGFRHRTGVSAIPLPKRLLEWSENHRNIDYNEARTDSSNADSSNREQFRLMLMLLLMLLSTLSLCHPERGLIFVPSAKINRSRRISVLSAVPVQPPEFSMSSVTF